MADDLTARLARYAAEAKERLAVSTVVMKEVMAKYPELLRVEVVYEGSGDSGAIESIEVVPVEGATLSASLPDVTAAAEDVAWQLIELYHAGYENNDGGGGEVTITQTEILYSHHDYYTEQTNTDHEPIPL